MSKIICSVCEKPIEDGFTVYDNELNPMHPGCAPKDFDDERKAQKKEARKGKVGVRTQRKIDSLWNKRERAAKRLGKHEVEAKKERDAIGEIDKELKEKDPQFDSKIEALEESQREGEALA